MWDSFKLAGTKWLLTTDQTGHERFQWRDLRAQWLSIAFVGGTGKAFSKALLLSQASLILFVTAYSHHDGEKIKCTLLIYIFFTQTSVWLSAKMCKCVACELQWNRTKVFTQSDMKPSTGGRSSFLRVANLPANVSLIPCNPSLCAWATRDELHHVRANGVKDATS